MPFLSSVRGTLGPVGRGFRGRRRDGLTQASAAISARHIKVETGANTDGVYWLQASSTAPAQQVYCIMDDNWDGGGWQIIAHNPADGNVNNATHYPRPTANATFTGTDGANSYSTSGRWSINALDMRIQDFVYAAYSSTFKNILSYSYGKYNTYTTLPDQTGPYTRLFDQFHQELPWLSGRDIRLRPTSTVEPTANTNGYCAFGLWDGDRGDTTFRTDNGASRPVTGFVWGARSSPDNVAFVMATQSGGLIGTYDLSNKDTNMHGATDLFSWCDCTLDTRTDPPGNPDSFGWDDYQDGNGPSDLWGIPETPARAERGSAAYIMIRSTYF